VSKKDVLLYFMIKKVGNTFIVLISRQVILGVYDEVKGVATMSYLYQVRKLFRLIEVIYNVD
jgi:hypothetical protein